MPEASLRYVIVYEHGRTRSSRTEYIRGRNSRSEYCDTFLRPSGRTVHVRTETIDTGERKEMFEYTARRVIIRTSYRYSPDDEARSHDTETNAGRLT